MDLWNATSDAISFPLYGNLRIPMRKYLSRFPLDDAIEMVDISESSVKEVVGIFFDIENNVRMVIVKTFKHITGLIFLLFGETIIDIQMIGSRVRQHLTPI